MKKLKVGINGFGRIGKAIFRINDQKDYFDVVVINDINPDIKNITYMLKYDTIYGRFEKTVEHNENQIIVGNDKINIYSKEKITDVPWENNNVDVVIDSSGIRANLNLMVNDNSGVKNYIVTNSPKGYENIKTIIFGVNEDECEPDKHKIFSSSICDTIALAPLVKLITATHQIESGYLITLHPWLSYQNLLDGASKSWSQPGDVFSHYALGRASTENLIPKSTSAIIAADEVFHGLSKKIQSFSYRTPTKIVSSATLILLLNKEITSEQLKERFTKFEETQKHKVIRNSTEPLTSLDYRGEEYSIIIDQRWTKIKNGKHVKLVYWYDNEWGYSSRVVDLVKKISEKLRPE